MKNIILILTILIYFNTTSIAQEEDKSHTIKEAIELGSPALEKNWITEDYKNFNIYLGKLSPTSYPRLESSKSKEIFLKVISSAEQAILKNEKLSLNHKIPYALSLLEEFSSIFYKYLNAHLDAFDYSMELSYLQGISLLAASQITIVVEPFIESLDPNEENYKIRMDGITQMKNGLATIVDGAFISLTEVENYSTEERIILANYIVKESLTLLNFLDPNFKREFKIKLQKQLLIESSEEIKKLLSDFLEKI